MKNNQFKKVIKQEIEKECQILDLTSVTVDITNNHRMIYIYTFDWVCVGIFSCYLNNDCVHIMFTTNMEKPIIVAKEKEVTCRYCEFNKVSTLLNSAFEVMDEES